MGPAASPTYELRTSPNTTGAIGILTLRGSPHLLESLLDTTLPVPNAFRVADLFETDETLLARWAENEVDVMFHGGHAVRHALITELERRGASPAPDRPTPEPTTPADVETRAHDALASAASPLAADLLLDQATRFAEARPTASPEHAHALTRLLTPPVVACIGPSNVGKSTLLNELAGRRVVITADEPGTTRDHVGVLLDLAGLVIRFVDTPGQRPDASDLERDAAAIAEPIIRGADLVLSCFDATCAEVGPPAGVPVLRVHLRRDLGVAGGDPPDVELSILPGTQTGIEGLIAAIREALVPQAALDDPGLWRFWA